jgi:hypothetical protein
MAMRFVIYLPVLTLLLSGAALGRQDATPPVAIADPVWHVGHRHIQQQDDATTRPMREMTADDKFYAREKRNNSVRGNAPDPSEMTTDGRREKMEKAVGSSRSSGGGDEMGTSIRRALPTTLRKPSASSTGNIGSPSSRIRLTWCGGSSYVPQT